MLRWIHEKREGEAGGNKGQDWRRQRERPGRGRMQQSASPAAFEVDIGSVNCLDK